MSENQSQPSLLSVVKVRQSGVRSVNVEHDLNDPAVAQGYVLTAQALTSLTRILNGLSSASASRAWTLTGPYGSGKSFFSLFLMNLVCAQQPAHVVADGQLRAVDPLLAEQASQSANLSHTQGLLPIPIAGYRTSLQECLRQGLLQALQQFAKVEEIQKVMADLAQQQFEYNSRAFTQLLQRLLEILAQPSMGYRGILLIFDELGKPLEHAASHPAETDIYLLQEIAEFANRSGEKPFVFIGVLHQAFERYATFLDNATQREWAKIQGRFEDIAFQEPPTQQMRLLVNALEVPAEYKSVLEPVLAQTSAEILESGWRPPLMRVEDFADLCKKTYPLHPSALVALPYVFRRLAQNERSIFAFLASHEPLGFQDFLNTHSLPQFLRLADIFDYLAANFQARLYASGRAHILTEALERLDNAFDLEPIEIEVLKTIGLLNWLGEVSHLQVTEPTLLAAMRSSERNDAALRKALLSLKERKMIVYRRFNQTYSIWQGSDVDIEERLEEASRKVSSAFSLAEAVQRYLPPRPLVARRHSYQSGTLRYFEVRYVDASIRGQVSLTVSPGSNGLILLCLPINYAEVDGFIQWAQQPSLSTRSDIVLGIANRTGRLAELLQELRNLHWVSEHTPELPGDSVARRELRARLAAVENLIHNEMEHAISLYRLGDGTSGQWFHAGRAIQPQAHQGLNHLLSSICDDLYAQTPRLWNELINRRALSSQAAAARRNLIEGLLQRVNQENLGIEAYPPERSMYESLLRAGGLHQANEQAGWILVEPPDMDPLRLKPAWNAIADFIFRSPTEPRSVSDLFDHLRQPPYGLTDGVLPVFLCAFLLVHQHETTFYREGSLKPELEIADWEVLLRRPELFAVAGCRIEGPRVAILERFGHGLGVQAAAMPVVRALIHNLKTLPEHAWRTQRLPAEVLAVRRTIETARSPERLLFRDLPEALGLPPFDEVVDDGQVRLYFDQLNAALQVLTNATPKLRDQARDQFLTACALPTGDEGWQAFLALAGELLPRASNPTLLPLFRRAAETPDTRSALESVLALIANRPLRTWTDLDTDRFHDQAQYLGELIRIERNGSVPAIDLPPEKRQRSQEVAADLQRYLEELEDDPQILEVALRLLTQEIRSRKKRS